MNKKLIILLVGVVLISLILIWNGNQILDLQEQNKLLKIETANLKLDIDIKDNLIKEINLLDEIIDQDEIINEVDDNKHNISFGYSRDKLKYIDIKDNNETVVLFRYGQIGLASLLGVDDEIVYFHASPDGLGGCAYAEYPVSTLYKLDLSTKELTIIDGHAGELSHITISKDLKFAGYVKGKEYILRDLTTGDFRSFDFPTTAVIYRRWVLSPQATKVAMIGLLDNSNPCFADSTVLEMEAGYILDFADETVSKKISGNPVVKPLWINDDEVQGWE